MSIFDKIYTENSIQTYTGKVFDLKILDPESICIEDIAHALSYTARFGGHLPVFYNVAQHSCLVSSYVSPKNRLAALLHDASEAYIGDMPTPFKKMMPDYKIIEENLMKVIASKFGFEWPLDPEIKKFDKLSLIREWDTFVEHTSNLECWPPEKSNTKFLEYYNKYI